MNADTILDRLADVQDQLRAFGVQKIGLFGSFSRGEAGDDSDLDFLIVLEPKTFKNYVYLKAFLEKLFDRDVDLVLEHTLREELRPFVLQDVLYG